MRHSKILLVDALINLTLGVLLATFPRSVVEALGVPDTDATFYPSILGAVLFGIGLALLMERSRGGGLGLGGAVAINLSGGVVLGLWLIFGDLEIPGRGQLLLWGLATLLVGISIVEILASRSNRSAG